MWADTDLLVLVMTGAPFVNSKINRQEHLYMTRPEASLSTSGCTSPFVLKEARTPDVDPGRGAILVACAISACQGAQFQIVGFKISGESHARQHLNFEQWLLPRHGR